MDPGVACGFSCLFMFVAGVVAIVVLGRRDSNENRASQERRPLEDRIRDFKESAEFNMRELARLNERADSANRPWVQVVINFYRRLGELAVRPEATAAEAMALSEEASQYEREQKLKGIFISAEARMLAALLQRRSQPPTAPS